MASAFHGESPTSATAPPLVYSYVPQYCRREKLRFSIDFDPSSRPPPADPPQGFSLTLSSPPSTAPPKRAAPVGPCGPFTGYAAVLARSRFLAPAQRLLEDMCDLAGVKANLYPGDVSLAVDIDAEGASSLQSAASAADGEEQHWRKTRLLSLMDEVSKRYKQYCLQVQAVMASFNTVAGVNTAAPYAATALNAMSEHFKSLKCLISTHMTRCVNNTPANKDFNPSFSVSPGSGGAAPALPHQRCGAAGAFSQSNCVWRPQRGLPERAVAVLRSWLFDHFLHPYPSDGDKQMLAKQTGLTRNQVSNWFINARVRLWKPMVEEIHGLEVQQLRAPQNHHSSDSSTSPSSCRRDRDAKAVAAIADNQEHMIPLSSVSGDQCHYGFPAGYVDHGDHGSSLYNAGAPAISPVSLTLGLEQNSRACFDGAPLPANLVRRFGLEDASGGGFAFSSLKGQRRCFVNGAGELLVGDNVGLGS